MEIIKNITQTSIKNLFNNDDEAIKKALKEAIEQFYDRKIPNGVPGDEEGKNRWFEIVKPSIYINKKFTLKKFIRIIIYEKYKSENIELENKIYNQGFGPDTAEAILKKWCPDDYKFNFYNNKKDTNIKERNMAPKGYIDLLKTRNQIILQGPPGTGKTRVAKIIAINMINENNKIKENASNDAIKKAFNNLRDNAKLIQFHPSYSYEDFVRGITAKTIHNGTTSSVSYEVENKVLADMAQKAMNDKENKPYILIIDEINRANLSSVLGELIYALEYRDEVVESMYALEDESRDITLPSNLYIIGTMNTADRSIGHIDYAIRRRFAFADVPPQESVITDEKAKKLFNQVSEIFDNISPEFDKEKVMLGHSYFIADDDNKLNEKLQYQIKPLLNEYVSDGVLNESAKEQITNLTIDNKDDEESDEN